MNRLIIIFTICMLFSCKGVVFQEKNNDNYGITWTYIFEGNQRQCARIVKRFERANIGQSYYNSGNSYILEFNYPDDIYEKNGVFYCVPRRLQKKVQLIEFMTFDGEQLLDFGGFNLYF